MVMIERFYAKFIPSERARYATVAAPLLRLDGARRKGGYAASDREVMLMRPHAVAAESDADLAPIEIITLGEAQGLAAQLGPSIDAGELQALINDRGTLYRWQLRAALATRPKPSREGLGQLVELLGDAMAKFDQLDDPARREMEAALATMLGSKGALTRGVAFTRASMARLQESAKRARANLPAGSKPGLEELRWLCVELATTPQASSVPSPTATRTTPTARAGSSPPTITATPQASSRSR
jgi:hypothetical protein